MSPATRDGEPTGRPRLMERIRRSILRAPLRPTTDQERKSAVVQNFVLHFRPVRVPVRSLRYTHTFGLGGMSLVLFLLLVGTGTLLMFGYAPTVEEAHRSVRALEQTTTFGAFVRAVHHWSANLLVLVLLLHLLRVFLTSAFLAPRQFNWVIGLCLLAAVAAASFTGYLLPWDQRAYWAVTITTGMLGYVPLIGPALLAAVRGGGETGQATLIMFYTLHTTVVPVLILFLSGLHFWRVRKAKGVVVPRQPGEAIDPQPEKVLGLPFLLMREFVVALLLVAGVFVFAAVVAAPLGDIANPGMSPNPAKAPWYFMGFQELLQHLHPTLAVVVLPVAAMLLLLSVPYLPYDDDPSGIWFVSARGRRLARAAAVGALVATPLLVFAAEWLGSLSSVSGGIGAIAAAVLLPIAALLAGSWLGWRQLRARGATMNEMVLTGFVAAGVAFTVLTVVGVWWRTEGMALGWAGW